MHVRLPVMLSNDACSRAPPKYYLEPAKGVMLGVVTSEDIEIPAGKTLLL